MSLHGCSMFSVMSSTFFSLSSLWSRCRAAFHKTRRQRHWQTLNTIASRICHIFIFNSLMSHKRDVIASPIAFQKWIHGYKPPIRRYDPEHCLPISFHLSFFHPILFLLSGVPWLYAHVLPLPSELKSQEEKYLSTGKTTIKQTADFKNKAAYSQADL